MRVEPVAVVPAGVLLEVLILDVDGAARRADRLYQGQVHLLHALRRHRGVVPASPRHERVDVPGSYRTEDLDRGSRISANRLRRRLRDHGIERRRVDDGKATRRPDKPAARQDGAVDPAHAKDAPDVSGSRPAHDRARVEASTAPAEHAQPTIMKLVDPFGNDAKTT